MANRSSTLRGAPRRQEQREAPQRSHVLVGKFEQAAELGRYEEEAGRTRRDHRVDEFPGREGRRAQHHRAAREQHRQREGAAAAEIERRRADEPVAAVQAEIDPVRHEPAEELAMRDDRTLRPPGRARGEGQHQGQIGPEREAPARIGGRDLRLPGLVPRDGVSPLDRRLARFHEDGGGPEMIDHPLPLGRVPARIHRQDQPARPRERQQSHDMGRPVGEAEPDRTLAGDVAREDGGGCAAYAIGEGRVVDHAPALDQRRMVRPRPSVDVEGVRDVHHGARSSP